MLALRMRVVVALTVVVACASVAPASAGAATAGPAWEIYSVAQPAMFSASDNAECLANVQGKPCDRYQIFVRNGGSRATSGEITIFDQLPSGLTVQKIEGEVLQAGEEPHAMACAEMGPSCGYSASIKPDGIAVVDVDVLVPEGEPGEVTNVASVEGGGAESRTTAAPTTQPNQLNGPSAAKLSVAGFALTASNQAGLDEAQAGGHPYELNAMLEFAAERWHAPSEGIRYAPAEEPRNVAVYLPLGLVGDPVATERCPISALVVNNNASGCPAGSRVGVAAVDFHGRYAVSSVVDRETLPIYSLQPEEGVPAEFGFSYFGVPFFMIANVVRTAGGYRLRVDAAGLPEERVDGFDVTFFGQPAEKDGVGGLSTAFLTDPTTCREGPLSARVEVDSWTKPAIWHSKEAETYPGVTGCDRLIGAAAFTPALELRPQESQVDSPSGYQVYLKVPQAPNVFDQAATPNLKNATVTLPQGVSVSPSAASGPDALLGCAANGPEGIDIPTGVNARGEALHPNEAGEGEEIGPNGLSRLAPGHCPAKSQIGTVELKTPLLTEPMTGHVYVAQPHCGGTGGACSEQEAEEGKVFGLYLEVAGSGVVIKLAGAVEVGGYGHRNDLRVGQLRAKFEENPQLPFEELKLTLDGGQRAALANPQTCGTATTTSILEPWSAPESGPNATPSSSFAVTGCKSPMPFGPSFEAGTVKPLGGEFSPFVLTLKRNDGEQDLGGANITMPPGVAGMLSKVQLCGQAQASAGTCSEASRVGTAHVAAGSGSLPLWLEGKVYLTGPYDGDPFGLSVVVPAAAGPYNLGDEVVRSGISVNPTTAQVSVSTPGIPQSRDGIPFRLKEINVTIDRSGFMFNPTNCQQLHLTGSVSGVLPDGEQGSTVAESEPFADTGCKNLSFKPKFKVATKAHHTRRNGAFLHVTVKSGAGQANIHKVDVRLPRGLSVRDSTLNQACAEAQYESNPAGCPEGSVVGHAVAHTPILNVPLEGPAYFVSHGGREFPNLDIVLQGEGVTIELTGNTFVSKKGYTFSRFETVPDAPISRFDLYLPEGPHSALAGNGNFCKRTVTTKKRVKVHRHGHVLRRKGHVVYKTVKVHHKKRRTLTMPTTIHGQNGALVEQATKIAVSGCAAGKGGRKAGKARGAAKRHGHSAHHGGGAHKKSHGSRRHA